MPATCTCRSSSTITDVGVASELVHCCTVVARWLALVRDKRPKRRAASAAGSLCVGGRRPAGAAGAAGVAGAAGGSASHGGGGGGTHGPIREGGERLHPQLHTRTRTVADKHRALLLRLDAAVPAPGLLRDA